MKKKLLAFALVVGLALSLAGCGGKDEAVSAPAPEPVPEVHTVTFAATGDNLIHGALYLQAAARAGGGSYDFSYLYENIASFVAQYDLRYMNQETLVNRVYAPSHYPQFSSPPEIGYMTYYDLGFRAFSLSNNHTYDKGAGGVAATLDYWDSMPDDLVVTGLWSDSTLDDIPLYEKNGITFAFLGYTEHTNGLRTPSDAPAHVIYTSQEDVMERQIRLADTLADVVVVCPHWGVEDSHTVSDAQRTLAQKMSDWGADLILGSHPHVLQEIDTLQSADGRTVPVIYSLGNFVSTQSMADQLIGGFLTLTATKTDDVTVLEDIEFHPIVMHYDANYTNARVYMYADYTDELAVQSGVRARYPGFGRKWIESMLRENIGDEYLVLTE